MPHKDPAAHKAYQKAWAKSNAKKIAAQKKAWAKKNSKKIAAYKKAYFKKNVKKIYRYRAQHIGQQSANFANYTAKHLGLPGRITAAQLRTLYTKYGHLCLRCGKKRKLTPDHIIPFSIKGCTNTIDNIQPLCLPCNKKKHDRTTDYRRNRHLS